MIKFNYNIYDDSSGDAPENDKAIAEQLMLAKVKQEYEQPERIVIRPKVKVWKDVLLLILTFSLLLSALVILHKTVNVRGGIFVFLCAVCGLAYLALLGKKLLLTSITVYQKYTPEIVRSSCLFEPCCSEYMRKSVVKYGAVKGFLRGIKRILRCRYPNGGVDEP